MAKYALSFTTKGSDQNTYYLTASVLGLVAEKHGGTSLTYGVSLNSEDAQKLQKCIDDIIDNPGKWDDVQCYPATAVSKPDRLSYYATKTSSMISYSSTSSGQTCMLGAFKAWLAGTLSANVTAIYSSLVELCIPYINYKIAAMSAPDYEAFVAAVIEAGGFSDYEQTNTPIQD